jgi:hypothetical protein
MTLKDWAYAQKIVPELLLFDSGTRKRGERWELWGTRRAHDPLKGFDFEHVRIYVPADVDLPVMNVPKGLTLMQKFVLDASGQWQNDRGQKYVHSQRFERHRKTGKLRSMQQMNDPEFETVTTFAPGRIGEAPVRVRERPWKPDRRRPIDWAALIWGPCATLPQKRGKTHEPANGEAHGPALAGPARKARPMRG